jgi:hypothetical protein
VVPKLRAGIKAINIEMSADQHWALKDLAHHRGTSIQVLVMSLIEAELADEPRTRRLSEPAQPSLEADAKPSVRGGQTKIPLTAQATRPQAATPAPQPATELRQPALAERPRKARKRPTAAARSTAKRASTPEVPPRKPARDAPLADRIEYVMRTRPPDEYQGLSMNITQVLHDLDKVRLGWPDRDTWDEQSRVAVTRVLGADARFGRLHRGRYELMRVAAAPKATERPRRRGAIKQQPRVKRPAASTSAPGDDGWPTPEVLTREQVQMEMLMHRHGKLAEHEQS